MAGAAEASAWRAYFEGTRLLQEELERRMKVSCGLDLGDFNVLLVLSEADGGRIRMGDLARLISFGPGRLTYRITALERAGLVAREHSAGDARGRDAVLTEAGRRTLRRTRPIHARHVEELFLARLAPGDAPLLERIFAPLRADLLAACAQAPPDPGA